MPYRNAFLLTKEQADFIKNLRVREGYSWRAIARDVSAAYPELTVCGNKAENQGNQIDGADLCEAAMLLLGEKVEDGWN